MPTARRLTLTARDASLLEDVMGYYALSNFGGQTDYGPGEEEPPEQVEHRREVTALAARVSKIHERFTEEA